MSEFHGCYATITSCIYHSVESISTGRWKQNYPVYLHFKLQCIGIINEWLTMKIWTRQPENQAVLKWTIVKRKKNH